MAVNVFEGGRRIAKLLAWVWIAVVFVVALGFFGLDGISRTEALWSAAWVAGGCIAIWLIALGVGWVMRGFLGISAGLDFPQDPDGDD